MNGAHCSMQRLHIAVVQHFPDLLCCTKQAGGGMDPNVVREMARLMPDPAGSDDLLAPGVV